MSETLRDLVVSLALDSDNFDRNIRLVNKELKESLSEFKLAGAGAENFEKSLKGMRARAESLRKQLDAQNKIVGQYGGKLKALNSKLEEQYLQYGKLSEKYREAGADLEVYREEVEKTRRELSAAQAANADPMSIQALEEKLKQQEKTLKDLEKEYGKLGGKVKSAEKSMQATTGQITDTNTALNEAQAEVEELTEELNRNENAWYTHGVAMQNFAAQARSAFDGIDKIGSKLTATVTTPLLTLGTAAAKASIDYEDAFAAVRKTVNVTGEDAEAFFERLSDSAVEMSTRLATSATDIAEVMAIAGQLGIENDELEAFTETIVRLGMSTNIAGEEAASAMAKFANVTGMEQDLFDEMGATLVALGNRFATTEADIMAMATRIAAAGTQVGLSESQILGFATALSSLGLEAEAGGSAFSKALKKMETAVATNSEALNDFAKVAGLTKQEFAELWKSDPADAFQAFIVGLSRMDEEGMSAIATLDEIGITELRLSDTLLRTANATELLEEAQSAANAAWAEGTALITESDTRLQTTASRLTNIKNSLVEVGMQFGETMAPEIETIVEGLASAVEWFSNLDEATRRNIVQWGLYAAAAGPVLKGISKIGMASSTAIDTIGRFSEAIGTAQATMKTTGSVAAGLGMLLGPGGKLMLGIGVAAAGIAGLIALYNRLEAAKPDLSLDASEIENYKIDVDELDVNVPVETKLELKEGIKSAKEQIIDILNDGLPEGPEEQKAMSQAVQDAIGMAYQGIEEKFSEEKKTLDELYAGGIIDEKTYNASLTQLNEQAQAMQTDLDTAAQTVTEYVAQMVANNRSMTDEEIAELERLLNVLGETAEGVVEATDAQMKAYEWSYRKTRLGIGSEEDQKKAAEYIELVADGRLQEIEAEEEALKQLYAKRSEGATEEEQIALAREETAALEELRKKREGVYGEKESMYKTLLPGVAGDEESLEELVRLIEKYKQLQEEYGSGSLKGTLLFPENGFLDYNTNNVTDALGITNYAGEMAELLKEIEPYLQEGSPIMNYLATMQAQGIIPEGSLETTEDTLSTLLTLAGQVQPAVEELGTESAAAAKGARENIKTEMSQYETEQIGLEAMRGLQAGIIAGGAGVKEAMRTAARAAVKAAQEELQIHSPSKVFKDEVGAMAMKGFGKGITDEAEKQARIIKNASRYLTGEAQAGAMAGGTDNRKTYSSESNVTVTGNTFVINDKQDIQSLATEIATMTRQKQRGRGLRMA